MSQNVTGMKLCEACVVVWNKKYIDKKFTSVHERNLVFILLLTYFTDVDILYIVNNKL